MDHPAKAAAGFQLQTHLQVAPGHRQPGSGVGAVSRKMNVVSCSKTMTRSWHCRAKFHAGGRMKKGLLIKCRFLMVFNGFYEFKMFCWCSWCMLHSNKFNPVPKPKTNQSPSASCRSSTESVCRGNALPEIKQFTIARLVNINQLNLLTVMKHEREILYTHSAQFKNYWI